MNAELKYPQAREEFFRRNRDFYRSLLPAMEKWNVNVLVENSAEANMGDRYFFMTGEEMRAFADYFDHPLLHCNWDIGHANMRGTDQRMEILAMGDQLRGLHIQDNFGSFDEHIAPFMGTTDLDAVMQGLLEVGYKGYFTFETENMLLSYGRWPHARRAAPSVTERRLAAPPLALRRKAAALLFEIGRTILSAYDCFEE
jgi:sugar phosphate isomerase/epimerase